MRKKVRWIEGKIDRLSGDLIKAIGDIDSYISQVEDKIKIFYPEDKEDDLESILKTPDKPSKSYVDSGDKGSGRPGSMRWHGTHLNAMEQHGDIMDYVEKVTGARIEIKGRIDYARKKALKAIKRFKDGNS